jgi:hypothetical protein
MKNITKWKLGDNNNLVYFEIVAKLAGCNQDCVQQLLDLRISGLRLVQDFANEINKTLNLVHMSILFVLDDNGCTDNLRSCGN